ncbi:MAG: hypothetical protein ACWA5L_11285 [bacterium]
MTDAKWQPDIEVTIRALLKSFAAEGRLIQPDELPSLVKSRLADQVSGQTDIDATIKAVLEQMKKAGEL